MKKYVLVLGLATHTMAHGDFDPSQYDTNQNGVIDTGKEEQSLAVVLVNPNFVELDFNKDLTITSDEMIRAFKDPDLVIIGDMNVGLPHNLLTDVMSDFQHMRKHNSGILSVDKVSKYATCDRFPSLCSSPAE